MVDGGGGWDTEAHFDVKKNNLFGNIPKTTQYFFLIISGPHRRVLKTFSRTFRIGKIGNFSTQKSPNVFFLLKKQNYKGFPLYFFLKGFLLLAKTIEISPRSTQHSVLKPLHKSLRVPRRPRQACIRTKKSSPKLLWV